MPSSPGSASTPPRRRPTCGRAWWRVPGTRSPMMPPGPLTRRANRAGVWSPRWCAPTSPRTRRRPSSSRSTKGWPRSPSTPRVSGTARSSCSSTSWCCGWRFSFRTASGSARRRRRSPSWSSRALARE
jgi:hypothetical protein